MIVAKMWWVVGDCGQDVVGGGVIVAKMWWVVGWLGPRGGALVGE